MTGRRTHRADHERRDALAELSERAVEIREAVRSRVLASGRLRDAAASANETAEDVAQAVFLRLWGLVSSGRGEEIRDLTAYAKKMADNHIASVARRPIHRTTHVADPGEVDRLGGALGASDDPAGVVEHRLSAAQVKSILGRLNGKQRLLIKMRFELGMKVPEMARVVGGSNKSCEKQLERAVEQVKVELQSATDLDEADRSRLSRVIATKRWATPGLIAGLRRDMRSDLRLASLWRQSNGALHDVAAAVGVDETLARMNHGSGIATRVAGWVDRGREGLSAIAGRTGPEHEAAAAAATTGAGAAKAMVAVCLAGTAAGSACLATGVVELPQRDKPLQAGHPVATQRTDTLPTTPTTPTVTADQPPAEQPPTDPQVAQQPSETPGQRVDKELGLSDSTSSASSSGTRDFAAPAGGSGSGGGGGGGSGGGGFSFEK